MNKFEIIRDETGLHVKAEGSTRAGLLQGVLKGMFAAMDPQRSADAKEVSRPFSVSAANAEALLVALMADALVQSGANHEGYEDIKFTLITDKKAEGSFVGRPVTEFAAPVVTGAVAEGLTMKKNDAAIWHTTVTFTEPAEPQTMSDDSV